MGRITPCTPRSNCLNPPPARARCHRDTPLEICAARDPRGLYRRARDGKIDYFTGVGAPYERPEAPDLHLYGARETPLQEAEKLIAHLVRMNHIRADVGA